MGLEIYSKSDWGTSRPKRKRKQYIGGKTLEEGYYAYLLPLHKDDKNLLAYTNKKIPLYVLQQLYYKLNNVDVKSLVLTRNKESKKKKQLIHS